MSEFEGISLGDKRLEARVIETVRTLSLAPASSFLAAAHSRTEAKAMYRLVGNDRVNMSALLEPHVARTVERCADKKSKILVLHDTSEFEYEGDGRRDLGRLHSKRSQGFFLHASLAVEAATRRPMGVVASKVWTRGEELTSVIASKKTGKLRKRNGDDYAGTANRESKRWDTQARLSARRLAGCDRVVHISDRESDIYAYLAKRIARHEHFVVRLARDKKARTSTHEPLESLVEIAKRASGVVRAQVPLTRRRASSAPRSEKVHPSREARDAKLEFAAVCAEIRAPRYCDPRHPQTLPVNVVHVRELDAPSEQLPVEWFLLTSEPIDTPEQVAEVVEFYRARWLIEEFFKALKTGCMMEKRELDSLQTLTNTLALCIPIAAHLLALRHLARETPDEPASKILSPEQIKILQKKARLRENPSAHDALVAVAYLGSYFTWNDKKKPGWRVMARGMERLLALEEGWLAHGI